MFRPVPVAAAALLAAAGAAASVEPFEDIHASADYKRDVIAVIVRRALDGALAS